MPRLRLLCEQALRGLSSPLHRAINSTDIDADIGYGIEIPPATLTRDLTAMLGDQQFADVRFVIEVYHAARNTTVSSNFMLYSCFAVG
jgi:hypothetical protein